VDEALDAPVMPAQSRPSRLLVPPMFFSWFWNGPFVCFSVR